MLNSTERRAHLMRYDLRHVFLLLYLPSAEVDSALLLLYCHLVIAQLQEDGGRFFVLERQPFDPNLEHFETVAEA